MTSKKPKKNALTGPAPSGASTPKVRLPSTADAKPSSPRKLKHLQEISVAETRQLGMFAEPTLIISPTPRSNRYQR